MSTQNLSVNINANIAGFTNAMSQVSNSAQNAMGQVSNAMGGAESSTSGGVGRIKSALGGIAGVLAGAFAVDKIKDFGISLVESAADSQAMTAQFEQVFGGLQGEATKAIDGMGQEFGMVSSRIKPAFTQMTSLFKGLGLDSEDAMDGASRAMTASADAAAFYDVSMEDASSALTSFMKGNWEAGESIGLFANEAQMASYASDTLGKDYTKLDEAGKQLVRLSFAESMQKSAGAMGQASRESGSYSNQLGNLKQIWTDLKAKLGQPILAVAIAGIKGLAEWIGKVDANAIINGFKAFGSYVGSVFSPIITAVKNNFTELFGSLTFDSGTLSAGFEGIKSAVFDFGDIVKKTTENIGWFIDKFDFLLIGIAAGAAAYKAITIAQTAWTAAVSLWNARTLIATGIQAAFNAVLLANPIGIVVVAIGALVAIGILLYKNWDTVTAFLSASWEMIKSTASTVWEGLKTYFATTWDSIKDGALAKFQALSTGIAAVWNGIKTVASTIWNGIKTFLNAVWDGIIKIGKAVFDGYKAYITTVFNIYKTIIMAVWNGIKSGLSSLWKGIKSAGEAIWNAYKSFLITVFNAYKTVITTVWNAIKSFLSTTMNSIKSTATKIWTSLKTSLTTIVNGIKTAVSTAFNNIKSTASTIWSSIKSFVINTVESLRTSIVSKFNSAKSSAATIFNSIKSAMTRPVDAAKNAIKSALDKIKGFFSGLRLSFPKITMPRMPKFSLTGKFSLMPPSVPKVGISWNAKGGVFNKPTVFNTANAGMQGVGEAGSEAIIPLSRKVLGGIGRGISNTMNSSQNQGTSIEVGSLVHIENFNGTKKEADSLAHVINKKLNKMGVR